MALQRDPAIVLGFVEEARSYLPTIREGVVRYLADEQLAAEIDAAYRLTHTIAGAASMVGLDELSEFARGPENALEEYALVGGPLPRAIAEEVGYSEPAAFRRIFKRATGISPLQYRQRFRSVAAA